MTLSLSLPGSSIVDRRSSVVSDHSSYSVISHLFYSVTTRSGRALWAQAQNAARMNQARLAHSDRVDEIRARNEALLSRSRDDYEEEVATVECYNASVQPVVQKADRANVLVGRNSIVRPPIRSFVR